MYLRRFFAFSILSAALLVGLQAPASSKVRFGKNVYIGGHNVSNQTFTKKRRGRYYIYKGKPRKSGCHWRKNRDGSRTKICHLQRTKRRR